MTPQILFLSHGGGPLPLLGEKSHLEMVDCLKNIAGIMNKPSAILVVSAHWEEAVVTITADPHPPLLYDYYGFPEEAYHIKYPCTGNRELAEMLHKKMERAGIAAHLDKERGFDHGLFVPLKIMYPEADIPCVQLSLLGSLDPDAHIKIGESLRGVDCDNLLVLGSGFSFHNMEQFFSPETPDSQAQNRSFETWLVETCSSANISEQERRQRLVDWEKAPSARFCHPREEHLLPLHVCYGMAQAPCKLHFQLKILSKESSMYLW